MNRTRTEFFDPTQFLGEMIDLTNQVQMASFEAMMTNREGGLDFFANMLKRTEEMTARRNPLLRSVAE